MNRFFEEKKNILFPILIAVTVLLIPTLFYIKYYLSDMVLGGADFVQYFSSKKAWTDSLLSGELVFWNKYLAGGIPEIVVDDMYPISTLLSFLPLKQYVYAFFVFHLALGALFFYLYLRKTGVDRFPAYIFMIIYETSIHINGARKGHPACVAAMCMVPIVFYLVQRFIIEKKEKWLYLSAFTVSMLITMYKQLTAYLMIILCIYLFVSLIRNKVKILKVLRLAVCWFGVFLASSAFLLIPYVGVMREYSAFGASDTTYEIFSSYSMSPIKLIQMIFPRFYGDIFQAYGPYNSSEMDIEIYIGIFVLAMAAAYAFAQFKKVWLDIVCALAALMITCVAHIPVLNKIFYHIPVIGGFRASGRALSLFVFFMMTIAAKGLSEYIKGENNEKILSFTRRFMIVIVSAAVVFCLVILLLASNGFGLLDTTAAKDIITERLVKQALIAVLIFAVCFLFKKKNILFAFAFLAITMIEIIPFSKFTQPSYLRDFAVDSSTEALLGGQDFKIWDDTTKIDGGAITPFSQNRNTVSGISTLNSYLSFNNPLLAKYMKNLGEGTTDIPFNFSGLFIGTFEAENILLYQNDLLSSLGVKYILDSEAVLSDPVYDGMTYEAAGDISGIMLYENTNARDIIYDADDVSILSEFSDIYDLRAEYSLDDTAYLVGQQDIEIDEEPEISLVSEKNDSVVVTVNSDKPAYICFSQAYSKKWNVYIDGVKQDADLVNGVIMGSYVPEGSHTVEFRYFDRNFIFGFVITGLAMVFIAFMFVYDARKGKKC